MPITEPYIFIVKRGVTKNAKYSFERKLEDGSYELINFTGKVVAFYLKDAKIVSSSRADFVLKTGQTVTTLGSKIDLIDDGDGFELTISAAEAAACSAIDKSRMAFVVESSAGVVVDEIYDCPAKIINITD